MGPNTKKNLLCIEKAKESQEIGIPKCYYVGTMGVDYCWQFQKKKRQQQQWQSNFFFEKRQAAIGAWQQICQITGPNPSSHLAKRKRRTYASYVFSRFPDLSHPIAILSHYTMKSSKLFQFNHNTKKNSHQRSLL